ncbi:MAG: 1-acyl-sn-glycerol-3-phosphate acyltransferase [Candidatus Eremiobacteraeota bacterium]|nr:1-acyl-sn-glycerol-3-phosphate acyltransferase [Candidatus Eremiobacteraeota bacterium]
MRLLFERRFAGLFWAQALGAFNDNLFRSALVVWLRRTQPDWQTGELVLLSGALLMLPYLVVSGWAGQLADRLDKARLLRGLKLVELGPVGLAVVGLQTGEAVWLLSALTLLGLQSALFGPAKYAILPELLDEQRLLEGNAVVESGTRVAILVGILVGGAAPPGLVGPAMVAVSLLGLAAARRVPCAGAAAPGLGLSFNPLRAGLSCLREVRRERAVALSCLGIAWFWLLGSLSLGLVADEPGLLAVFLAGVAAGATFCRKVSFERTELGLVPIGSLGVSLLGLDLCWFHSGWRGTLDFLGLSFFAGLFVIPLYALVQERSAASARGRVLAGANLVSAALMVAGCVGMVVLIRLGLTVSGALAAIVVLNTLVAYYIYSLIPEFGLRFLAYLLAHGIYRLRTFNLGHIPSQGPAVLVCNHVTFIDWLIVAAVVRRPVRFVMWYAYFDIPVVRRLFRDARVIPIAPARKAPEILEAAFDRIAEELEQGQIVCIFPEGMLTLDGEVSEFKPGIERIVARTPVPVVPMALRGLWGSFFSKARQGGWRRLFTRELRSRVELDCLEAVPAQEVSAEQLRASVLSLRGDRR